MKYRTDPKTGNQLSILGFGCMRFPRGLNAKTDMDKTERLILSAIDRGVNYFDTAYIYPGSEQALGKVLHRNPQARDKIYIATKLPCGQCKSYVDFDRLFHTQLERLHVSHIDYYLMHNLTGLSAWEALCKLGIERWIAEKKGTGQIRQIGFSFHGMQNEFLSLLESYDWDFCQIQYNYMNEEYQAGKKGLQKAYEMGLPVIIMEPLLGGKLAAGLPQKAARLFHDSDSALTPAAWALRWLWNHKEVTVLLSGMNSFEQLDDNITTAQTAEPGCMTKAQAAAIAQAVSIFRESFKIPCTGCNYCLPCPKGVNIPGSFAAYNVSFATGFVTGMMQYVTGIGAANPQRNSSGRNCVQCGQCETRCPQHIEIIDSLKAVTKRMEPFWFKTAMRLFHKLK